MWSRQSLDNGATWLADDSLSDVASPLPAQPDSTVQSTYAGDYDYGTAIATKHLTSWDDGRVTICGQSQQDTFFDHQAISGGGGVNLVSAASRLTHGAAGTFDISMPLTGTSGVEDRSASTYNAVFTFDAAVTSGQVSVVSGTATVGTILFSGNSMTAPLTGVTTAEVVTLRVQNINGDGLQHGDVPFGFLVGDADANRLVAKADGTLVQGQFNQTVTSANFREDINADGRIKNADVQVVKANVGHSIP